MTYAKAIITFIGVLCTALGTAASDGGLTLAEILISVGGAIGSSGVVAVVPNKVKADGTN